MKGVKMIRKHFGYKKQLYEFESDKISRIRRFDSYLGHYEDEKRWKGKNRRRKQYIRIVRFN